MHHYGDEEVFIREPVLFSAGDCESCCSIGSDDMGTVLCSACKQQDWYDWYDSTMDPLLRPCLTITPSDFGVGQSLLLRIEGNTEFPRAMENVVHCQAASFGYHSP